jgi:sugar porter (SP) family MFS transporter
MERARGVVGTGEDPNVNERGGTRFVLMATLVATLGGLLFGYDTAVISGAIGYLTRRFSLDAQLQGWAVSSALVGCILGASVAGVLSDRAGRKRALIIAAMLFAVSAIGSALARDLTELAIARILGGLAIGAASMLSPLYISELAPARIRGRLVSLNQFAIVFGMLLVYFVNAYIARRGETIGGDLWNVTQGWRWMFGSEILPALLFFGLLFFVPESPRWLLKQGRRDDALRVLTAVGGPEHARREMAEIVDAIAHEEPSLGQLLRPGMRVVLVIGIALAILQQVTGINTVLYYAPKIFESAGLGAAQAIAQTVIVGVVNLTFTVVAIMVVDRLGRKPLLLAASACMGVSLFLLGGAFVLDRLEGPWVLLFVLMYVASFAVAMGPVVWVVLAEIFPTRIRGRAMSIATVCLWIACFGVSQLFPWMLERFEGKSFFIYAVMCVVAFVFVALVVPETKGKTLEEIERHWLRGQEHDDFQRAGAGDPEPL